MKLRTLSESIGEMLSRDINWNKLRRRKTRDMLSNFYV